MEAKMMYVSTDETGRTETLAEVAGLLKELILRFEERDRQVATQLQQIEEQARQDREALRNALAKIDTQLVRFNVQSDTSGTIIPEQHKSKRLEKRTERTDKLLKELERESEWNDFVEDLAWSVLDEMFQERGIKFNSISHDIRCYSDDEQMQIGFSLLASGNQYAMAIFIRHTLTTKDIEGIEGIDEHIEKLSRFRQAFDNYADKQVIGAVAGIVIDEEVYRYACNAGLFVIGENPNILERERGDDMLRVLNDVKFVPRHF
ncbi:hypothetical protein MBAV_000715 [Candidatus Magnetobacterium bavaricum]|uniref:Uncharacterized protein n=1 Tax=Candidatus Magnetobacterium bavaricum TaxID=29290 RepID=A0A0F3GZ25_9BACT|nr:hypothetical protein MBAV_000715 [Candidatus Magnetobacterium bavaricum]